MDSIISTFHIDWKIIIAQAINFVIVFAVLYFYALKPLSKLMKERSEKISQGLDDAKQSNLLFQKASDEYKDNTVKLRKMSIDTQQELQKDLEKLRAENLNRIKADNEEWTKKRLEQLEIDKKALVESAKSELVSLAILATEKLLNAKIDKSFDGKAVKELNNL
jgi:F-type H+-transporting ATPase subunit b